MEGSTEASAIIVRRGSWLYQPGDPIVVEVWGLTYDFWYELAMADDLLDPDEKPSPLGAGGRRYHARFRREDARPSPWPSTSTFLTIAEAMRAAERKVTGPIRWDSSAA